MSNAVKMSDVFRGRDIAAYGCNLVDRNVDRSDLGKLGTNGMAKAAAHAINQHDALVAMNAELVEALTNLINDSGYEHSIHPDNNTGGSPRSALISAKVALDRAKELTQ
tara:strand:- start:66 stop:392 length:327 start_codon:yes stop_codon:yes gene_type:complete